MTKQIALDFSDLRFLEIGCRKCATKVTLDARAGSRTPGECPGCFTEFEPLGIRNFLSAYRELTHQNQSFIFRVIVNEPV